VKTAVTKNRSERVLTSMKSTSSSAY